MTIQDIQKVKGGDFLALDISTGFLYRYIEGKTYERLNDSAYVDFTTKHLLCNKFVSIKYGRSEANIKFSIEEFRLILGSTSNPEVLALLEQKRENSNKKLVDLLKMRQELRDIVIVC